MRFVPEGLRQGREGRAFTRFLPADDPGKLTDMSRKVASWKIIGARLLTLNDLARGVNPALRGWLNYFTVFYPSMVIPLCWRVDRHLMHWARRKYKRLERGDRRAREHGCVVSGNGCPACLRTGSCATRPENALDGTSRRVRLPSATRRRGERCGKGARGGVRWGPGR